MNNELLAAIAQAPDLPELLAKAERTWAEEQRKRLKFLEDITPEHKWEFINGEVILHSPALNRHLLASQHCFTLLHAHCAVRQCGVVRHEKALTSFPRNDYEPDVMFFGAVKAATLTPDTLRFPVPDLIVEVLSPSTEKRDRGIKFRDYALHGVQEYWIVDTIAESVEVYLLAGEVYPGTTPQTEGQIVSSIIPGLVVPIRALFDPDENLLAVQRTLSGMSA